LFGGRNHWLMQATICELLGIKKTKIMYCLKLAYYREEDWKRFLNMIDDRESMHNTWREWHKAFEKSKKEMIKQGFEVQNVVVDLDELAYYCLTHRIPNNGKARAQFVLTK